MNSTIARRFNDVVNMQSITHQQDDVLFNPLLTLFQQYRDAGDYSTAATTEFTTAVAKVTNDTLNIKVIFTADHKSRREAYMHVPRLDRNHPLLNLANRKRLDNTDLRDRLNKDLKTVHATIDPKTGRVGGFLSELECKIVMGIGLLDKSSILTPEESTAVYLHELGHVWTYFYMLGSTLRTNVVIHAATQDYEFGKDSKADHTKLIIIEELTGTTIDDKVAVAAKGNDAVAISLVNRQVTMQRSEYGTTGFDESGSEAIADQFTARQGAGVHLVTGLDKLQRTSSVFRAGKVVLEILATLSIIGLHGSPLLIAIFLTDPTTGTYDDPFKRAKRVREQIVSSLKDKGLSTEMRRKRLTQLDVIDSVMDKIESNESLFEFIWRRVIEGGNSRVKNKLIQEGIESLINNDLYVLGTVLTINKS